MGAQKFISTILASAILASTTPVFAEGKENIKNNSNSSENVLEEIVDVARNVSEDVSSVKDSVLEQLKEMPIGLDYGRYKFNQDDLTKYKSWVDECVDFSKSKKGQYCLVIDKAAREMDVYVNGEKKATYPVELGWNPVDDKTREGDGATPEGVYKIRFIHKSSVFGEALWINYPNKKDKEEFKQRKKDGTLSKSDSIGGAVEIHGSGNCNFEYRSDWTAGCSGMCDNDIASLYKNLGITDHKRMSKKNEKKFLNKLRIAVVRYGARDDYTGLGYPVEDNNFEDEEVIIE